MGLDMTIVIFDHIQMMYKSVSVTDLLFSPDFSPNIARYMMNVQIGIYVANSLEYMFPVKS